MVSVHWVVVAKLGVVLVNMPGEFTWRGVTVRANAKVDAEGKCKARGSKEMLPKHLPGVHE